MKAKSKKTLAWMFFLLAIGGAIISLSAIVTLSVDEINGENADFWTWFWAVVGMLITGGVATLIYSKAIKPKNYDY